MHLLICFAHDDKAPDVPEGSKLLGRRSDAEHFLLLATSTAQCTHSSTMFHPAATKQQPEELPFRVANGTGLDETDAAKFPSHLGRVPHVES